MPRNKYHDSCVVEFHEVFGAPVAWTPAAPSLDRIALRVSLLIEEVLEFAEASGVMVSVSYDPETGKHTAELDQYQRAPNLIEAADALADIRYVTDGASLEWGIPLEKCLREVHRSNMSKLGEDGKPVLRDDGKVLKGPHYMPPQIAEILELYKGVQNG